MNQLGLTITDFNFLDKASSKTLFYANEGDFRIPICEKCFKELKIVESDTLLKFIKWLQAEGLKI